MAAFLVLVAILALLWFWLQRRKPRRNWQDDPTDFTYDNVNNSSAATGQDVSGTIGGGGDFAGAGASGSWESGGGDSGGGDGGSSGD